MQEGNELFCPSLLRLAQYRTAPADDIIRVDLAFFAVEAADFLTLEMTNGNKSATVGTFGTRNKAFRHFLSPFLMQLRFALSDESDLSSVR